MRSKAFASDRPLMGAQTLLYASSSYNSLVTGLVHVSFRTKAKERIRTRLLDGRLLKVHISIRHGPQTRTHARLRTPATQHARCALARAKSLVCFRICSHMCDDY